MYCKHFLREYLVPKVHNITKSDTFLALKIHMSEDTCKVLELLGSYQYESRGERQVKGRGLMTTYWLLGKDDSDYELPPEHLALSASQHNFK